MNAATRTRDLEWLASGGEVDVLVVGGGITGAFVALDAATRGLSVALLERADLATGTSRWSSKLAHGGLRYLATGQVGIAWESARERALLMRRIAPHLVTALPFVVPVGGAKGAETALGLRLGDGLRAASRLPKARLPRSGRIPGHEARALVPALAPVRSALLQWDGRLEDDARLVVAVARTAAAHGARIVTHARVLPGADRAVDERTGTGFALHARKVVWATGVWSEAVPLRPSKGSHVLVRPEALGLPRAAVTVPLRERGGWAFAVPTPDGPVLVGLTDEPFDGAPVDAPPVEAHEERSLLEALSVALEVPLRREDVVGRFAGLRPLLEGDAETTRDLSRRHAVVVDGDHVSVVGGKLTTARRMAQDAVDVVSDRPCRTERLPLLGAGPRPAGAHPRLARRFGTEAEAVAGAGALRPLADGLPHLEAEVAWALTHELALDAEDVERRLRLDLVPAWRAAARPALDALVGDRLNAFS